MLSAEGAQGARIMRRGAVFGLITLVIRRMDGWLVTTNAHRDQVLAAQYTRNWQAHAQHSQPYVGRGVR
jgi:hypothetical protein